MKKKLHERSHREKYDIDNLSSIEARERAKSFINLLLPKTPNILLKRYGSQYDGGYVLADDISTTDYLLSFGVASNVAFEDDISSKVAGMDLYDPNVNMLPHPIPNGRFFKEKITWHSNEDSADIKKCMARVPDKADYILKIDIEGFEWEFFTSVSEEDLLKFRQVVIEFHWIDKILDSQYYEVIKNALIKMNTTHQSVNVHGNNYGDIVQFNDIFIPEVLEVTFLRKNSYTFGHYSEEQYDKLNAPCNPNFIDISFVYRKEIQ